MTSRAKNQVDRAARRLKAPAAPSEEDLLVAAGEVEAAPPPSAAAIERLMAAMRSYDALLAVAAIAKQAADFAAGAFAKVAEVDLPEAASAAGLPAPTKTTIGGRKLEVKSFMTASIAGEKKTAGIAWLEANGGANLIKATADLVFPKGEKARRLRDKILKMLDREAKKAKIAVGTSVDETVNHQTLSAWVRERHANGLPIDREVLGVREGRVASLSPVGGPADKSPSSL